MIAQQTIEEVREVSLVKAVEKIGPKLKKEGKEMVACCPFHNEKSPSFKVNETKGVYKCYGCGKGGNNAISFYMEHENLSYPEAIKRVAEDFGIEVIEDISEQNVEAVKEAERLEQLSQLNERALVVWSQFPTPDNSIRHANAADFEVVFAPDSYDTLKKELKDVAPKTLHSVGLLGHNEEKDHYYDFWRNRLIFPIRDTRGRLVGFGGESMEATPEAKKKYGKYINTKGTESFDKSKVLFGLGSKDALGYVRATRTVNLVEGYWDVVACHRIGRLNTAASCGTAFTPQQAKLIKKYADNLTLMRDSDSAGIAATMKDIPTAIEAGLNCQVCILPEGKDPDDIVREHELEFDADDWTAVNDSLDGNTTDAIMWYAETRYNKNDTPAEQSAQLKDIAKLVALIKDGHILSIYLDDISKRLDVGKQVFRGLVENAQRSQARKDPNNTNPTTDKDRDYDLPTGVVWSKVREDISEYGMFIHKNLIYMKRSTKKEEGQETTEKYYFKPVSNFSIRIIQHMDDPKSPKQLIEICNVHKRKRTFETSTDDFVTEAAFKKMLGRHGNFHWSGTTTDFDRLAVKLKEEMGDGRMITVLGWQPEGFFAFTDRIVKADGSTLAPEKYGQFDLEGTSYYIPSGNEIYKSNDTMYGPQRRVTFLQPKTTLESYWDLVGQVHGRHAYNSILFSVAAAFSDVVYNVVRAFPLMFLYGPAGSGKDQLIETMQSLFGKPQSAISLTGKSSTEKGKMRQLAQFRNMLAHLSEYRNGQGLEDWLKDLYDRRGYMRATMDYNFTNEEVPINSAIIYTGNDYPTDEPVITRSIANEMTINEHSLDETKRYGELRGMIDRGISGLLPNIIKQRKVVEGEFRDAMNAEKLSLHQFFDSKELKVKSRMIENAAVLGATYNILNSKLNFPFEYTEWRDSITWCYQKQLSKMKSGSSLTRFWEGFLFAIRDKHNPLRINFDFKLSGNELIIQWSACYQAYQVRSWQLFHEQAKGKSELQDALKKSDAWIKAKDSVWMQRKTSGWVFNVDRVGPDFLDDLQKAITTAELNQGHKPEQSYDDKRDASQTAIPVNAGGDDKNDDDLPF